MVPSFELTTVVIYTGGRAANVSASVGVRRSAVEKRTTFRFTPP
jgi:hypothetical protein